MDDKIWCSPDAERKQATEHKYAANQSSIEQYHRRLLQTKSVFTCAYQVDISDPNSVNKHDIQLTFTPLASAPYRMSSSHIQVCKCACLERHLRLLAETYRRTRRVYRRPSGPH